LIRAVSTKSLERTDSVLARRVRTRIVENARASVNAGRNRYFRWPRKPLP
jgi:hypothetical protein